MSFEEFAYGIIPVRGDGKKLQIFLVKMASGNHWGFPKGRAEIGENPKETAVRELQEEAGLQVVEYLPCDPFIETYFKQGITKPILKKVEYFLASVKGEPRLQEGEVLDGKWVNVDELENNLTYDSSKKVAVALKSYFSQFGGSN